MEKNQVIENPIEMVNQTIRDFKELCRLTIFQIFVYLFNK